MPTRKTYSTCWKMPTGKRFVRFMILVTTGTNPTSVLSCCQPQSWPIVNCPQLATWWPPLGACQYCPECKHWTRLDGRKQNKSALRFPNTQTLVPSTLYLTYVSLFSIIASTANFSQNWAVIMAIVGCWLRPTSGICRTRFTWVSSLVTRTTCLPAPGESVKRATPLATSSNTNWWTSSSLDLVVLRQECGN